MARWHTPLSRHWYLAQKLSPRHWPCHNISHLSLPRKLLPLSYSQVSSLQRRTMMILFQNWRLRYEPRQIIKSLLLPALFRHPKLSMSFKRCSQHSCSSFLMKKCPQISVNHVLVKSRMHGELCDATTVNSMNLLAQIASSDFMSVYRLIGLRFGMAFRVFLSVMILQHVKYGKN